MNKILFGMILSFCTLLLQGQFLQKENDKLIIGNGFIERELNISENHCFTQSMKLTQTGHNFVNASGLEFSFVVDNILYHGKSDWRVVSTTETKDKNQGKSAEITLRNDRVKLDIVLTYTFYPDLPIIRKHIRFINRSSKEIMIEAVDVEKVVANFSTVLFTSYGRQKHLSTYYGDHDDALAIVHDYYGNKGILFANEAPGVLKKLAYNTTRNDISVGLTDKNAQYPFRKYLAAGQGWDSPSVVILPYSNALDPWEIMNSTFADFQRKYSGYSIFANRDRRLSFMYNNYVPFNDNFDEKLILELAESAAECGIRQFTIDCGWYTSQHASAEVNWINNCGDYLVDKRKFPNGLKYVFDRVRALGLEPGLWISVASASEWAEVFCSHQKWRLLDMKGNPTNIHDGSPSLRTMCMATNWKEYIKGKISDMVQEYGLKYVKLDLAAVSSAYINEIERSGCYATDHPGHKDHAESYIAIYTELFKLFDELHQKFPGLFIDCTFETEGKMQAIDYSFRQHADGNWLTNFEEPYPIGNFRIRNLAWWRSPAMPASSMLIGNRRLDTPEGINELRTMMGTFPILLGDLRKLSKEQRKEIKRWGDWIIELQKKYDYDLFRQDLPGFGEPAEGSWDGYARINTETKRGGIVGIFRQGAPDDKRIVLITNLIPDAKYVVKPDPSTHIPVKVYTGKELAESGFEVILGKKYEGRLFEIEIEK